MGHWNKKRRLHPYAHWTLFFLVFLICAVLLLNSIQIILVTPWYPQFMEFSNTKMPFLSPHLYLHSCSQQHISEKDKGSKVSVLTVKTFSPVLLHSRLPVVSTLQPPQPTSSSSNRSNSYSIPMTRPNSKPGASHLFSLLKYSSPISFHGFLLVMCQFKHHSLREAISDYSGLTSDLYHYVPYQISYGL